LVVIKKNITRVEDLFFNFVIDLNNGYLKYRTTVVQNYILERQLTRGLSRET